jgi:hypothetical protein
MSAVYVAVRAIIAVSIQPAGTHLSLQTKPSFP